MNHSSQIEKHLADGLTDEEAAAHELTLHREPEAVRRFVAAARLEERLAAKLGPPRPESAWFADEIRGRLPARGLTRWRRPLTAAAAVVLMLGLAAAVDRWLRSSATHSAEPGAEDVPPAKRVIAPGPLPPAWETVPRAIEESETPAMASLRRLLSSYYLTELQLGTPRPVEQALEQLLRRAREVNHLRNPAIERLSAELVTPEEATDPEELLVSLPIDSITLLNALQWMAALNRSEVFFEEPGVITFRPWEPGDEQTYFTDSFAGEGGARFNELMDRQTYEMLGRGRPNPSTHPDLVGDDQSTGAGLPEPQEPAAPLTTGTGVRAVQLLSPVEVLQSWGIAFAGEATATYDPVSGALTVRQTASGLRMIKALLSMASTQPASMINISAKTFEFTQGLNKMNEVMTDKQFDAWLNQFDRVYLCSAPQVTARSAQRAVVEVIHQSDPIEGVVDWQGLRIGVEPVLEGEVIRLTGEVELRLPVDRQPGQLLPGPTATVGEFVTTATDFEGIVPDGKTTLFSVSESQDGPQFVMAITVNRIDPSGQRLGR